MMLVKFNVDELTKCQTMVNEWMNAHQMGVCIWANCLPHNHNINDNVNHFLNLSFRVRSFSLTLLNTKWQSRRKIRLLNILFALIFKTTKGVAVLKFCLIRNNMPCQICWIVCFRWHINNATFLSIFHRYRELWTDKNSIESVVQPLSSRQSSVA